MNLPAGGYYQLSSACETALERKKSVFHTLLAPARDRAEAEAVRTIMAARHPDCRHLCFALVLGPPHQPHATTAFDAGEPSGTAGRPMLNLLLSRELGDVVAVVARYFGGIKLGAGGLARAYAAAVGTALDTADLVVCEPQLEVSLLASYSHWERAQYTIAEHQARELAVEYGADVAARISVPTRNFAGLRAALAAIDHRLQLIRD